MAEMCRRFYAKLLVAITLLEIEGQNWPGPFAEMYRGFLLCKFWRILPGILLKDFSGHFFLPK